MSKSHQCYDSRCKCEPENEYQTPEYVPPGPVVVSRKGKDVVVKNAVTKPSFVARTAKQGWLYDAHTGLCLGPASDELKAEHKSGEPWERHIAGMKQKVVIG